MSKNIIVEGKEITPLAIVAEGEDAVCIWKDGNCFRHGIKTKDAVVPSSPISKKIIEVLARVAGIGASGEPLVPVQYVGLREKQKEPLYGTGWWDHGQIKKLAMDIATKLLRHPEFERAKKESNEADEVLSGAKEKPEEDKDSEAKLQAARDSVANMDLEALKLYAASNFNGFKLHHKATVETARNKVIQLIDQYGVPE